jgi:dCMP deaminase
MKTKVCPNCSGHGYIVGGSFQGTLTCNACSGGGRVGCCFECCENDCKCNAVKVVGDFKNCSPTVVGNGVQMSTSYVTKVVVSDNPLPDFKWEHRFLELAQFWANKCSKDPSRKVGAVIVRPDTTIVSMGYNGFPRGVKDDASRYEERELKLKLVVHAEENAILTAKEDLSKCTIFSTLYPCSECTKTIIQAGIKDVVCYERVAHPSHDLAFHMDWSAQMFSEAGVVVTELPNANS